MNSKLTKYWILLLLTSIFILPIGFAWLLHGHPRWIQSLSTNHGQLKKVSHQLKLKLKEKKWSIVAWYPKGCDKLCENKMDELHRVRLALGRLYEQVDCILVQDQRADGLKAPLKEVFKKNKIQMIVIDSANKLEFLSNQQPQILLVDPREWVILTYSQNVNPMDVLFDMRRLIAHKGSSTYSR
jgi:hypothetical protein